MMLEISTYLVNVEPLEDKHFGKSEDLFLIVIIDVIAFHSTFYIVHISFKIFVIIVSFAFF